MIDAIKYFLAVVEEGNFARAAWSLKLAPSVITKKIKQLEDKLGYKLFYRTTRKVTLTPEGEDFLKKAQCLDATYNNLFNPPDRQSLTQTIKICTKFVLAKIFILPYLNEFSAKFPNVKYEFIQDASRKDMIDGKVDLIIDGSPIDIPGLNKINLFNSRRRLYASPIYIAQHGIPKTPQDLLNHNCIISLSHHPEKTWHFDNKEITPHAILESHDGWLNVQAAVQGIGIINAPEELVLPYVKSNQLVPLDMPVKGESTNVSIMYLKFPKDHIVRKFVDFIAKKAKK